MSFCAQCSHNPPHLFKCCDLGLEQHTDGQGRAVSKYLGCPKFKEIDNPRNWREFLDEAYA